MTPYEIGILLHYYSRAEDHPDIERDPPIFRPTMNRFLTEGYLRFVPNDERDARCPMNYEPLDRLKVYCAALQCVPEPQWAVDFTQVVTGRSHDCR